MERFKLNKKLFHLGKCVELRYPCTRPQCWAAFPFGVPINVTRLRQLYSTNKYSDVNIYIEGHGLIAKSHNIVLSLWSLPFAKMLTNGMCETNSSEVVLRDISPEAFQALFEFMYSGELNLDANMVSGPLLLELFLLADQFGVTLLHQECCKTLLECLTEGWSSSGRRTRSV